MALKVISQREGEKEQHSFDVSLQIGLKRTQRPAEKVLEDSGEL